MIFVCTVHFKTEDWIKPQLFFLKQNLHEPYRVFACVPEARRRKDFYLESCYDPPPIASQNDIASQNHADKLNYLARLVCEEAGDDDILIFLDGDAFPVALIAGYVRTGLRDHPFMAVQRPENGGDLHPHPCFAAATVGFWKSLRGDWSVDTYINASGIEISDAGGALYNRLSSEGFDWMPILRSNRVNPHPLWFGIYGGVIYHHGAGYRDPISRLDLQKETSGEYIQTSRFKI